VIAQAPRPRRIRPARAWWPFLLQALIASGATTFAGPSQAASLTLWAEEKIRIEGDRNFVCGLVHSNRDVEIKGTGNTVTGNLEYGRKFKTKDGNSVSPIKAPATPMPRPAHDVKYYRALARAQGGYYRHDVKLNAKDLGRLHGLIFAEEDISVVISGITATVT
jgi:hypothetical protein